MRLTPKKYTRKPFEVEAVEVTAENMEQVSKWCRGQLRRSAGPGGRNPQRYIKVPVKRYLNDRQTQAYVGDWVVTAIEEGTKGFKVYTPKAFAKTFDEIVEHMFEFLDRAAQREEEEDKIEENGGFREEYRESTSQMQ